MTGSDYERTLARILSDKGMSVMRSPSSGAGTSREQPDILAASPTSEVMAIELKSTSDSIAYVDEQEVLDLEVFAELFNASPYLVARFTDRASPTHYYFVRPEDARITDGGNYALPLDDISERSTRWYDDA